MFGANASAFKNCAYTTRHSTTYIMVSELCQRVSIGLPNCLMNNYHNYKYANIIFVHLYKLPTFNVEQNYNINWFEKRTGLNLNVFLRFSTPTCFYRLVIQINNFNAWQLFFKKNIGYFPFENVCLTYGNFMTFLYVLMWGIWTVDF